jgi:hypothetical protein
MGAGSYRGRGEFVPCRPGIKVTPPGRRAGAFRRFVANHLGSRQVSRVIYGAIIGLALVVALEAHPPTPGAVIATLLGTAVAVALAEFYSEFVAFETIGHRKAGRAEVRDMAYDGAAVAFGIAFPVAFFVLAAADAIEEDTAFTIAKWSGVGLIGFYGFCAARLAGKSLSASALRALGVALIGAFLIALKALLH